MWKSFENISLQTSEKVSWEKKKHAQNIRPTVHRTGDLTKISAAADRPARRICSVHAKYSEWHMVIKPFFLLGPAAEYRSRRWVWSTIIRRPSDVYHTQRRTKLASSETISRSRDRDMVGAHQNSSGSRDLTTPLPGMVCHPWANTCYRQPIPNLKSLTPLTTKIWQVIQNVENGVVWGGQGYSRSPEIAPIDKGHTSSYQRSVEAMSLSCTISDI